MALQITVRGQARDERPAERATLQLEAVHESADKQSAVAAATAVQEALGTQLRELEGRGAVTRWSAGQISVWSHRPWTEDGKRADLVHTARLALTAEFVEFGLFAGFVDHWAGRDNVQINGIGWDVSERNRRIYEAEARRAAVEDAVAKAQSYADAVRRGRVVARELADPDMLTQGAEPRMAKFAMAMDAGAESGNLVLTPPSIEILVAVDARFEAE